MLIGINRKIALGDVIMSLGVVKELLKRGHKVKYKTNKREALELIEGVEFNNNLDDCDKVYDLDLVYEKRPKVPVWVAYADEVFGEGNYNPEGIKPDFSVSDSSGYYSLREKLLSLCFDILDKPYVVLHASNNAPERTWSADNWNELARRISDMGYVPVTVGIGKDFNIPSAICLKDMFSLQELYALIVCSKGFIGCDSGLSHIAMGTDAKSVIIYTTAKPEYRAWGSSVEVVRPKDHICRFCLERLSPPVTCVACPDPVCIKSISVDDVMEGVRRCGL